MIQCTFRRSSTIRRTVLFLTALAFSAVAQASVPPLLNYQGVLHDASGVPVPDGNYSVTFRIWDSETDGIAVWQEGRLVTIQDGLFTVLLGSIVPIPDSLFSNPNRWIGLQVGLDSELSPRQRLVSVPFAWHSLTAESSSVSSIAQHIDTNGYSAYADLVSEGRIGNQPDQVAAGDHMHPFPIEFAAMVRIEDTADSPTTVATPGSYSVKSISVPAGEIGRYIRIFMSYSQQQNSPGAATHYLRILLNGEILWSSGNLSGGPHFGAVSFEIGKSLGNQWLANVQSPNPSQVTLSNLSPTDGLEITVEVWRDVNNNESHTYEVPELIVIYDRD